MAQETTKLFNTPMEIGLRALFILSNTKKNIDLQTLVYYDYLLIHSADVDGGPDSIHPSTPLRSGEILIKRELMQKGLGIMHQRELIDVILDSQGINYHSSKLTGKFLDYHTSSYSNLLSQRAKWVNKKFGSYSNERLRKFMDGNLEKWASEFVKNRSRADAYEK